MELLQKLLVISLTITKVFCFSCDRLVVEGLVVSEQTKSNIGKYLLEIDGKPEKYSPNEKYLVTIKSDVYNFPGSKFKRFVVRLDPRPSADDSEDTTRTTGNFELILDGLSKFSHACHNTIVEANTQPKSEVTLKWVAPPPNSGCVTVKAVVIESNERWFADDKFVENGHLTKTLCESFDENEDVLPEVLEECCACDEAKYEMSFQGNWIRNNHPKGFPVDPFTTRFSDIVGASHKNGHNFWAEETEPSEGLKELASKGDTRSLESELMDNIANLHTIIKARGLSYPNITSSSYAIFRVDKENHLVSLVSKMIPSPDWIIGVSNFELCLSNCSWKQYRTVNLYPKDVGVDNGLTYTEREPADEKQSLIKPITTSDPADPKSPFYDESGAPIKPIAQLHFKLEKIYKKVCPSSENETPEEEKNYEPNLLEEEEGTVRRDSDLRRQNFKNDNWCKTIGWSSWSECSVECGKGHKTRNVIFKHNPPPKHCENIAVEETLECEEDCESNEEKMSICRDVVWNRWSPCSVTCGKGIKIRYKYNKNEGNRPRDHSLVEKADKCDQMNKESVICYEGDC